MYSNILLATDGSDLSKKGVRQGLELAKALNAKATVITVTEPIAIDYGSGFTSGWVPTQEDVDRYVQASREFAEKLLDDVKALAMEIGITVDTLYVPNCYPASAIVDTARSKGCDLIVMASHGRRGFRKLFLGSQTSEVLAEGNIPVLVVR